MFEPAVLILIALAVDALIGDPGMIYRRIPHPVVILGRAIAAGERVLNRSHDGPTRRIASGGLLVVLCVSAAAAAAYLLHEILAQVALGRWLEAVLASSLLASRSLYDHVRAVAIALHTDLDRGREAVSHIVGRDPATLNDAGVARAAIESAAENFSDGVVAPVFWGIVLGLPGLVAYKTINTLDSMIGHRTTRYLLFGRVAARLDDVVNWIPARIAGAIFCVAAGLLPGASAGHAWSSMRRHARAHGSPNAGWQEAAVAGALGIALAGPRHYSGHEVDDAWMGDGRRDLNATDVHRALQLYLTASAVLVALVAGVATL